MNDKPLVSIGLAVYNGGDQTARTIDSLLAQTFTDFELIISNNCSTDQTARICKDYYYKDLRISYYSNSINVGALENFNQVFCRARGKYFMWSAHDDYREPEYIETCLKGFEKSDKIVLVGTACNCVDQDGNLMLVDHSLSTVGLDTIQRFKKYKHFLHMPEKHRGGIFYGVYKREVLDKVMPMMPAITCDQNMMLKLCLLGEFETVDKVLLTRTMTGASNSANSLKALARSYNITNPFRVYGAYIEREHEIKKMIKKSDLSQLQKINLCIWSLMHTFIAVSMRVIKLGIKKCS